MIIVPCGFKPSPFRRAHVSEGGLFPQGLGSLGGSPGNRFWLLSAAETTRIPVWCNVLAAWLPLLEKQQPGFRAGTSFFFAFLAFPPFGFCVFFLLARAPTQSVPSALMDA